MGNMLNPFQAKGRQESAERGESAAAQTLSNIGNALFARTGPLRDMTTNDLMTVLAGGRTENMRVFAPEREAIEGQFRRARENVLSTTPTRGGQLNRSLVDLELARAGAVGGLESDVRRNAFAQALGIGFGAPPVAIQGLGASGQIFGQGANRALQETQSKNQSIGMIAGMAAMCWIAEALYGRQSEEFRLARLWIVDLWDGRLANASRWLYRLFGRRVSRWRIVWAMRPVFDRAVRNARLALETI